MPRLRFTLRRLMVGMAVVAGIFGSARWLHVRSRDYRNLAAYYGKQEMQSWVGRHRLRLTDAGEKYRRLRLKYERAARCPWLLVEPDPPEPE
jgi:hypothetical protein